MYICEKIASCKNRMVEGKWGREVSPSEDTAIKILCAEL